MQTKQPTKGRKVLHCYKAHGGFPGSRSFCRQGWARTMSASRLYAVFQQRARSLVCVTGSMDQDVAPTVDQLPPRCLGFTAPSLPTGVNRACWLAPGVAFSLVRSPTRTISIDNRMNPVYAEPVMHAFTLRYGALAVSHARAFLCPAYSSTGLAFMKGKRRCP